MEEYRLQTLEAIRQSEDKWEIERKKVYAELDSVKLGVLAAK